MGLYVCVCVGKGGGKIGKSIRKASIVSVMESNWRASEEDAWSPVPFEMGLGWTPFKMGDAAGGILSDDVIFYSALYVYVCMCIVYMCICLWQSATERFFYIRLIYSSTPKRKKKKKNFEPRRIG